MHCWRRNVSLSNASHGGVSAGAELGRVRGALRARVGRASRPPRHLPVRSRSGVPRSPMSTRHQLCGPAGRTPAGAGGTPALPGAAGAPFPQQCVIDNCALPHRLDRPFTALSSPSSNRRLHLRGRPARRLRRQTPHPRRARQGPRRGPAAVAPGRRFPAPSPENPRRRAGRRVETRDGEVPQRLRFRPRREVARRGRENLARARFDGADRSSRCANITANPSAFPTRSPR